eukprot:jgi/Ulvmu1/5160/UM021_0177.1
MTPAHNDLYSGFDVAGVDLLSSGRVTQARRTTSRNGSAIAHGFVGTGVGRTPLGTGMRSGTGNVAAADGRRPVTAVKAAGYTSTKSPSWREAIGGGGFSSRTRMPSPQEICKEIEMEVHAMIEDAADLLQQGQSQQGHDVAQNAMMKVEELRQQCETAGIQDIIIVDLQFAVRLCLAQCAQAAGMDQEALVQYTAIAKNSDFQMAGRVRANIGNIFARRGHWTEAIKQYRMALDQIPTERQGTDSGPYAGMQCHLLRNIGIAFLQQGMYSDARENFEAVLAIRPDVVSAFNRLVAVFMITKSVEQSDSLKAAFRDMLNIPQLHDVARESEKMENCVRLCRQVCLQT